METPAKVALWVAPAVAALGIALTTLFAPGVGVRSAGQARLFTQSLVPTAAESCADDKTGRACGNVEEMEVRDVVPLKEADTHAVVLVSKKNGTVLPVFVDEPAAVAIAFKLAHRKAPHDLAPDLLDKVVEAMGGTVTEVRIDRVKGETFQGRIFIKQGEKNLALDARPADSLAIAIGRGAKIYASTEVLAQAGITRDEIKKLHEKNGQLPPGHPGNEGPGLGGSGNEGQDGPGVGGSGRDDDQDNGEDQSIVPEPKKEIRL